MIDHANDIAGMAYPSWLCTPVAAFSCKVPGHSGVMCDVATDQRTCLSL